MNLFRCKVVKPASILRGGAAFTRLFTIVVEKWFERDRVWQRAAGKAAGNRKGRDIGYALAVSSCEGASNVESCTITAFDVITAFAVPNPGHILAE